MPQFFTNKDLRVNTTTKITGQDAHHIINVLRLCKGDWCVISDGKGRSFKSSISNIEHKSVFVLIQEEIKHTVVSPAPHLAFAVIKHDRTEQIIQKAVEIGCTKLYPFCSTRTIPKYTSNVTQRKSERWQKIAIEAAKQSGLSMIPQVSDLMDFSGLCSKFAEYKNPVLFWEGEKQKSFASFSPNKGSTLIIIGPEGGFSESEIIKAKEYGAKTLSLGKQILRVETAAVVALGIMQLKLGNLCIEEKI